MPTVELYDRRPTYASYPAEPASQRQTAEIT